MRFGILSELLVAGGLLTVFVCGLSLFSWGAVGLTPVFMVLLAVAGILASRFRTHRSIRAWAQSHGLTVLHTREICCDYSPYAWPSTSTCIVKVTDQAGTEENVRLQVSSYLAGMFGYFVTENKTQERPPSNTA